MQKSSFFNSVNGDRKYKAEEWAEYFSAFIGNGIFPNPSTNLMVQPATGTEGHMNIIVKAGKAWINGYFFNNTEDTMLAIDNGDVGLKRIDGVVVRWSLKDRAITLEVKKGVKSSFPVAPYLQRDADVFEIALAEIEIGKNVAIMFPSMIRDLRYNSELCGIVTQTVQTIDTTYLSDQLQSLFNEYQAFSKEEYETLVALFESLKTQSSNDLESFRKWLLEYRTQATAQFMDWFNNLQNVLDENTETNIFSLISDLSSKVQKLENVVYCDIVDNPFSIAFGNLDGILSNGVWNESLQRIEC